MPATPENVKFHLRQALGRARRLIVPVRVDVQARRRLHLGCGAIDVPGYTNIDGIDRPHVHHIQAIDRLPNFSDGAFDQVYSSHTLEHFGHRMNDRVLKEWRRVLARGGWLTLSVPDFDQILKMYELSQGDLAKIIQPLFGGRDYPFNFHATTFNEASLTAALNSAGFSEVRRWRHGSEPWHTMPDWSGRSVKVGDVSVPISLNLEACK